MLKLSLSSILIEPNRQRREFPPARLAALASTIAKHGLFHPIHVHEIKDRAPLTHKLIHGERRLRAIKDYLWPSGGTLRYSGEVFEEGFVPATLTDTVDPLTLEEAEFSENEDRDPFTWQERADATSRLALLRRKQSEATGAPLPTVDQIAQEVRGDESKAPSGSAREDTRREILIAPHLSDPDISGAKSLDEAWKKLKAREEAQKHAALATSVGRTFTADLHSVIHGDCVAWMEEQPSGQFDVIATDPPYGINAQDFGDAGGRLDRQTHEYDDSPAAWASLMARCAPLWFTIAKPQAHLYVCCDIDRFITLKSILDANGWRVHRTPIINYKLDGNRVPWPSHGPQRKWEMILYAIKGDKPTTGIFPDVMLTKGDENFGHGAQKPIAMFQDLLRRSVRAGDRVLDTFGGTGTLIPAAHAFKCSAVVVELEAIAYGIALKRLQQIKEGKL